MVQQAACRILRSVLCCGVRVGVGGRVCWCLLAHDTASSSRANHACKPGPHVIVHLHKRPHPCPLEPADRRDMSQNKLPTPISTC